MSAGGDYPARVLASYLDCALWAGLDWSAADGVTGHAEPLDRSYSVDDVAGEARAHLELEVRDFLEGCAVDLEGLEAGQVGHDFYLTRNGHGAGFWDRGLGARGDRLTAAAHAWGESELYVGDDGKLYV